MGAFMEVSEFQKYLIKSKFGIGRDFSVFDDEAAKHKIYFIDAKMGLGTEAYIKNVNDEIVYILKGKILNIPRKLEVLKPNGETVAAIVAHYSPIKSRITVERADGDIWRLEGNLIHKNYQVLQNENVIINIDQKWLTVRDKYFVEIAKNIDIPLALSVIWAVDIWREDKNN